MAVVTSPACPNCGDWNVRVSYEPSSIEGSTRDKSSGKCHACKHEWSDDGGTSEPMPGRDIVRA
jgi:transposase-like protein